MSKQIIHTDTLRFEEDVLASDVPVVVDFWAAWCGPCRTMGPHLEALAENLEGEARVVKVDVDANPKLAQKYGITGLPTLVRFAQGVETDRLVGNPGRLAVLEQLARGQGHAA